MDRNKLLLSMYQIADEGRIKTKNGSINVFQPDPADILIDDIAHSLSYCVSRWLACAPEFMPVAAHCIAVSKMVSPSNKMAALLHDAAEAYLGDLPAPIKQRLPGYKELHDKLNDAILDKFGVSVLHPEIKIADRICLESDWVTIIMADELRASPADLSRICYNSFLKHFNQYKSQQ